ncbi:DUF1302 domain-containing protein [Pseudoduganella namucuonensis]|uniref:DUF1302 family protein n=1 Tax=Pseudoduganella namucuonensis TaxID=1035707 RepID=A0A1I7LHZ9_9BURK|nr:DUF1302 family protein [Pseudoduganella namucuonensis]SFV09258.1 Protein of unknown function [Pseudoduganella namucuonensis]
MQNKVLRPTAIAAALLAAGAVHAAELELADPDWSLRFDNTLKASTLYRLHDADPALVDSVRLLAPGVAASAFPQALNFNAGNDNFRNRGLVSRRVDLLSEFDAVYRKRYGLRVSAAAWYDHAYEGATDAADRANGQTPYNAFPESTRQLAGRKAELLDAFVFGGWDLGDGAKLNARLGRHALVYGESLFFGDNGIARAQGPIDIMKLQSSPNAQFKEIIRPVQQVSGQLQLNPDVMLGAYYQFRWEADRMAPAGSYFNTANNIWGGSTLPEFIATNVLLPGAERQPSDHGQFGAQLKWRLDETDLGFYAARYHDKSGVFYSRLNVTGPAPGSWYYVFPDAVTTAGFSATRSLDNTNLALEVSFRDDMPLVNANIVYPNVQAEPRYARGRTAHVNLSWLTTLGPSFLSREATLIGELAWNRVLSADDPAHTVDELRTRDASALQLIFSPAYRQPLPGLDLSVPLGLRYALHGNSAITGQSWGARHTGSATLGVDGTYQGVWQFSLNYNKYLGKAEPFVNYKPLLTGGHAVYSSGNPLADRDHLSLSVRRTF